MEYTGNRNCKISQDGFLVMKNLSEYQFEIYPRDTSSYTFTLEGKIENQNSGTFGMKVFIDRRQVTEVSFHVTGEYVQGIFELKSSVLSKLHNNHVFLKLETEQKDLLLYLKSVKFEREEPKERDTSQWMEKLNNDDCISRVSIPGSHDCAAFKSYPTPYACHRRNITKQLESGIRLLDVRLSVRKEEDKMVVMTCHGDIGNWKGIYLNEYQSFESLIGECRKFLEIHNTEFLVMTLKIDSLKDYKDNEQMLVADGLNAILQNEENKKLFVKELSLPTVGAVRGKIVLLSRIGEMLQEIKNSETESNYFGPPISWEDNKKAVQSLEAGGQRKFKVLIQDLFKTDEKTKIKLACEALNAFGRESGTSVCLNYISACKDGIFGAWGLKGLYINGAILEYLGKEKGEKRICPLGWLLMDQEHKKYSTDMYGGIALKDMIIDANFGYSQYKLKFRTVIPEAYEGEL